MREHVATAVPFLDLAPMHEPVKQPILEAVAELFESNAFINGPAVAEFEQAFATYCERNLSVGLASGLDALKLALLAGGIERGDEVLVPANTFIATFEAVSQAGGKPVVVDVTEDDLNIDVGACEAALTPRTRFLMPVHLYGQLADMRALGELAERRRLEIVEDAAQAHGATRDGLRAGASGLAGCFSFYPGKNLGALGDAGALVTDDEGLAERARALREHGQRAKYHHDLEGFTARLDTIQALALLRKLPLLDAWNEERRAVARFYTHSLEGVGDLRLPLVPDGSEPVWHLYVIRTADPAGLAQFLAERGVGSGRHYPQPVHLSPAYASLSYGRGSFPVTEELADRVLSLPVFPGLAEEQLDAVVGAVRDFFVRG